MFFIYYYSGKKKKIDLRFEVRICNTNIATMDRQKKIQQLKDEIAKLKKDLEELEQPKEEPKKET